MMKIVVKVELFDDKTKQKAMKTVSGLSGVESVSVDMKDKKLILIGDIDPIRVVRKLRKLCHAEIVSAGPAKEEKKKEETKPQENKDIAKALELVKFYETYPVYYQMKPQYTRHYQYAQSVEEDPIGCVIC